MNEMGLIEVHQQKKPSLIVRSLATLIFDDEELRTQSITGKKCNFNAKRNCEERSERLDPKKLEALKGKIK